MKVEGFQQIADFLDLSQGERKREFNLDKALEKFADGSINEGDPDADRDGLRRRLDMMKRAIGASGTSFLGYAR